jgi:SAM-dependent methyltransferase
MASSGYEATGLEPFSLGKPTEEPRLKLVRAPLGEVRESLGTFDVVTMWHVLEHIEKPVELFADLLKLLRPGGVLVLSVPNFASWQSRAFQAGWFHLDPPRHVNHFEAETLDKFLERFSLDVVDRRTFHVEYGPVGWLQSALNKLTPHPNFLFEFVKDRGALAGQPVLETALNAAISFSAGAALAAPSFAAELVAAARGAGSVLTRVARPRRLA